MNKEKTMALMELSNFSLEKDRVNPNRQLKPILIELRSIETAVNNGIKQEQELDEKIKEKKNEILEIENAHPKLEELREKAKERLALVKGMSLKEMISIQQVLAKAEENLGLNETKTLELGEEIEKITEEIERIKDSVNELKRQYNNKVAIYNKSKRDLDLALAALESREETLRQELEPEMLALFDETARLVPLKPVAFLRNDICTGCCVGVSSQTRRLVANSDTLQCCENCKRILLPMAEGEE